MHTHDEEARKFFRHSGVHCVLAPRYASNKLSIFKQQVGCFLLPSILVAEQLYLFILPLSENIRDFHYSRVTV